MSFDVNVDVAKAIASYGDLAERLDFAVKLAVKRMALAGEHEVKISFGPHNDGHRRPDGRTTDSPIGSPPMQRTGKLKQFTRAQPVQREGFAAYSAQVGSSMVYSRPLELGLQNGAVYPFLNPAMQRLQASNKLKEIYYNTIKAAIRK